MLKLVMATSRDGVVSLGPDDDMMWTGPEDKRAFRLITSVGGVLGAGRPTYMRLPVLKGRTVKCLSNRRGWARHLGAKIPELAQVGAEECSRKITDDYQETLRLGEFTSRYPEAWIIGGQTLALEALGIGLIGEVFLCRAAIALGRHEDMTNAQLDRITPLLRRGKWENADRIELHDRTVVEVWRVKA